MGSTIIGVPLAGLPVAVTLKDLLGLPENITHSEVQEYLGQDAKEVEQIIGLDPNQMISPEAWASLSSSAKRSIILMAGLASSRPIFMIHDSLLTKSWLTENKRFLSEKLVIVCSQDKIAAELYSKIAAQLVAAVDYTIVSLGSPSWTSEKWAIIRKSLQSRLPKAEVGSSDLLNLEDDDE